MRANNRSSVHEIVAIFCSPRIYYFDVIRLIEKVKKKEHSFFFVETFILDGRFDHFVWTTLNFLNDNGFCVSIPCTISSSTD